MLCSKGQLNLAMQANGEALKLAIEVEWDYIQFRAEVMAMRLQSRLGQLTVLQAQASLDALGERWSEPEQQAALEYERYRLALMPGASDPDKPEDLRRKAATAYADLYRSQPNFEIRQRAEAMAPDDRLPDLPELPALMKDVASQHVDLEKLLEQAGI